MSPFRGSRRTARILVFLFPDTNFRDGREIEGESGAGLGSGRLSFARPCRRRAGTGTGTGTGSVVLPRRCPLDERDDDDRRSYAGDYKLRGRTPTLRAALRKWTRGRSGQAELAGEGPFEAPQVRVPPRVAQLDCLAARDRLEIVRKLIGRRHPRALHEHRHHRDVPSKRCRNFVSDEVLRILEASTPVIVDARRPVSPDQHEEHTTGAHRAVDRLHEIRPGSDIGQIHEDGCLAKAADEGIEEPSRMASGVVAAIADEHSRHVSPDRFRDRIPHVGGARGTPRPGNVRKDGCCGGVRGVRLFSRTV